MRKRRDLLLLLWQPYHVNHLRHHPESLHLAGAGAVAVVVAAAPEAGVVRSVFAFERLAAVEWPTEGYEPSSIPGHHGARLVPASAEISMGSVR